MLIPRFDDEKGYESVGGAGAPRNPRVAFNIVGVG